MVFILPSRWMERMMEKKWRKHPPSSYSLKIQNFSQLENFTAFSGHKYESRPFSSGGYNWRLIVYPKGNKKDNGKGFISMYVELDRASSSKIEVFAKLSFFVYNKKKNIYLTMQDSEVRRFNVLNMVWGMSQVLPCDTFNNPKNGYVFEGGQCEFGVDVIVALASPLTNWEILSFNEKFNHPKFSWTIKKFSELKEDVQTSDIFSMGGKKCDKPKADEKIFTKAHVRVLDPGGSNHVAMQMNDWYVEPHFAWGWHKFLCLDKLRKVYLDKDDSLKVEIEFQTVSATEYSH